MLKWLEKLTSNPDPVGSRAEAFQKSSDTQDRQGNVHGIRESCSGTLGATSGLTQVLPSPGRIRVS